MENLPVDDEFSPGPEVVVVGGGPAGLRATEVIAARGHRVTLFEGKASVGRKFLVAGRGGLNLTHSEDLARFTSRYGDEPVRWENLLKEFGPEELRAWTKTLGVETYVGTSGRVFPVGQQAAVLLRRWVARLRTLGVRFQMNQRLQGLTPLPSRHWRLNLRDPRTGEEKHPSVRAVVLALGGASWPQTGSDGTWPDWFNSLGIPSARWQSANCGFEVAWDSRLLEVAEGLPLKNIAVTAGEQTVAGELLITRYGLEGGSLYQLGRTLRGLPLPRLTIDLKPGVSAAQLVSRLPAKCHQAAPWNEVCRAWKLSTAAGAILRFCGTDEAQGAPILAARAKRLQIELRGPRPIAEAISSAGGMPWNVLGDDLMCRDHPGLFVAGEMIDWEAPTGGYLLQGCLATGTRAGRAAADFLRACPRV